MSLIKWSNFFEPFDNFDKYFDGLPAAVNQQNGLVPAIDVYEKESTLVVETALPGVDPKNVEISIEGGMLTISGSTERKTEIDEKDYYRKEIRQGHFRRQLSLPQGVDESEAKASFKGGILTIELKKKELTKPKKITIELKKEDK
ncbi:MAG: Hsp20/alpha crystallin family protein [Patescibacteria group bacterium]|nr:Hsp20/alpha crystallin family protein [Patescibacteria group bacterium]